MDSTQLFATLLAATWLVGGFIVAVFMRRAGRDFHLWLVLGVLLGPFAGLFAPEDGRRTGSVRGAPRHRSGEFDVIAGIDGSPESVAALQAAVSLFGNRMSSLTLASVLDKDSSGSFSGMSDQVEACEELRRCAGHIEFEPVEIELLYGPPARALANFAEEQGVELIVVGARGHGMSRALFGSVTRDLVGRSDVPIFVGPGKTGTNRGRRIGTHRQAEREAGAETEALTGRRDLSSVQTSDGTGDIQAYARALPIL
jgi:nucleotide-binding universal stress UspA family protein